MIRIEIRVSDLFFCKYEWTSDSATIRWNGFCFDYYAILIQLQ